MQNIEHKHVVWALVIAVVLVGGWYFYSQSAEAAGCTPTATSPICAYWKPLYPNTAVVRWLQPASGDIMYKLIVNDPGYPAPVVKTVNVLTAVKGTVKQTTYNTCSVLNPDRKCFRGSFTFKVDWQKKVGNGYAVPFYSIQGSASLVK